MQAEAHEGLEQSKSLLAQATEAAKEAKKNATNRRSTGRRTSRTKIPASVDPGWLHYEIADAILSAFAKRFAASIGDSVAVDVGEVPTVVDEEAVNEGREPRELLARIIAHAAYRVPGVRGIEKRLEGKERKSGIWSDVAALMMQLYRRNKHLIPIIMQEVRSEVAKVKAQKVSQTPTGQPVDIAEVERRIREGGDNEVS